MKATKLSISFYPAHIEVIDHYAQMLGLRGNNVRSPTLQKIVSEWAEARGYTLLTSATGRPIYSLVYPMSVGYLRLSNLASVLDLTQPVYLAPQIETKYGTVEGQHTDHHYIIVTQPDPSNRVHYCRIPAVQLVYHNGIAFAPDYGEQLAKVEQVRGEVETWLAGEEFKVWAGMVALPQGMMVVEGRF